MQLNPLSFPRLKVGTGVAGILIKTAATPSDSASDVPLHVVTKPISSLTRIIAGWHGRGRPRWHPHQDGGRAGGRARAALRGF